MYNQSIKPVHKAFYSKNAQGFIAGRYMQAICWDNKNMPTQSDKFFVALLDETTPIHLVFGTFDDEIWGHFSDMNLGTYP